MNTEIRNIENSLAEVESQLQYLYKTYDSITEKINTAELLRSSLQRHLKYENNY